MAKRRGKSYGFYLVDAVIGAIDSRDANRSRSVAKLVGRFASLLEHEAPELEVAEWAWVNRALGHIPAEVEAAEAPAFVRSRLEAGAELGDEFVVDSAIAGLGSLTPTRALAILDEVERARLGEQLPAPKEHSPDELSDNAAAEEEYAEGNEGQQILVSSGPGS